MTSWREANAAFRRLFGGTMAGPPDGIHTIPVPRGWSAEQAWEAIKRGDDLTDKRTRWANVRIENGRFVELLDG